MLIVGLVVVMGAVIGGFMMAGGHIMVLVQVAEFVIIGGAALGAILVGNPPSFLRDIMRETTALLKPSTYTKESYLTLFRMLFTMFNLARRDGLLALESHAEHPEDSEIYRMCPDLLENTSALLFISDTSKVMLTGAVGPHDLMEMMEIDLEVFEHEQDRVAHVMQTTADAMPGFGIVAAVLGIIVTMASIGGNPAEIGAHIAAALVGTMLGVLLCYGVFGPIASAMVKRNKAGLQYMHCIRYALFSFARGESPITCIEFGRRNVEPDVRPSFTEMEIHVRQRDVA
ncbi:MAG: flagellar motor stator protein MotA [Armatimonadetes bacterium]|nr:flagellar motor stator protein MotA [Armatimonadota bacterium]